MPERYDETAAVGSSEQRRLMASVECRIPCQRRSRRMEDLAVMGLIFGNVDRPFFDSSKEDPRLGWATGGKRDHGAVTVRGDER